MWYYIDNIIDENFFYSINKEAFMKKIKKLVSMLLVFAMTFSVAISGKITGITQVSAREALGSNDFLKVNGTQIRKQKGTGDIVYLRGTNAGGWLVQEDWMNPTNASDQKTMMTTLANRFGASKRDELVSTYLLDNTGF